MLPLAVLAGVPGIPSREMEACSSAESPLWRCSAIMADPANLWRLNFDQRQPAPAPASSPSSTACVDLLACVSSLPGANLILLAMMSCTDLRGPRFACVDCLRQFLADCVNFDCGFVLFEYLAGPPVP